MYRRSFNNRTVHLYINTPKRREFKKTCNVYCKHTIEGVEITYSSLELKPVFLTLIVWGEAR